MEPLPSTGHAARHEIYDELDWNQPPFETFLDTLVAAIDKPPPRRAIILNENTSIGPYAWRQRHYRTSRVYKGGELQHGLEARVYLLDSVATETVSPKERKHRLRCIKRLDSRTILRVDVPKFRIVVFAVDPADDVMKASVEAPSAAKAAPKVVDTAVNPKTKHEPGAQMKDAEKSCHQRISTQARQRDRRQAGRKAKREQVLSTQAADQYGSGEDQEDDDGAITVGASGNTEDFWMLVLIYLAYDEEGWLRDGTPSEAGEALQGMNRAAVLKFCGSTAIKRRSSLVGRMRCRSTWLSR